MAKPSRPRTVRSFARELEIGGSPMLRYLDAVVAQAGADPVPVEETEQESTAERHDEILAESYLHRGNADSAYPVSLS